ncbi:MAG TPA: tetratricopeptide repeat protein [Terriglobales bacterium]|nr:tetratricopeptide repeat protein [Terriglobales bacterium]
MKKYIPVAAVLFAISLCAAPLWAQMEGSVRGVVKDQSGKPMAGAVVQLYDAQTGRKYEVKTNNKGEYRSIGIYLGTYKVTLLVNGNVVDEHNNVPIAPEQEQVVDFDESKNASGGLTPEQQAKIEAQKKNAEKIKGLNASLTQAKELEGAGNYDQAITLLTQATQIDPSQDLIWGYLGDAQRGAAAHAADAQAKTKAYQDSIESYQKALAIKPTSAPYHAGLADAYARTGQTEKAVQEYAAAAQADPQNAGAYYYNEGVVFTNTNKSDEAVAAFDKAIQADPNRADSYYLKGQALIAKSTTKGDKMVAPEGTAEAFQKYLELQPTGKYAEIAKQMLAALGAPVQTNFGKPKSSSKK